MANKQPEEPTDCSSFKSDEDQEERNNVQVNPVHQEILAKLQHESPASNHYRNIAASNYSPSLQESNDANQPEHSAQQYSERHRLHESMAPPTQRVVGINHDDYLVANQIETARRRHAVASNPLNHVQSLQDLSSLPLSGGTNNFSPVDRSHPPLDMPGYFNQITQHIMHQFLANGPPTLPEKSGAAHGGANEETIPAGSSGLAHNGGGAAMASNEEPSSNEEDFLGPQGQWTFEEQFRQVLFLSMLHYKYCCPTTKLL